MELRERILTSVLDAGFDRAGCIPLSMAGDAGYGEWIGQGMHGEMGYLARHAEAKADPATAFPLYRTVVVAALEYGESVPPSRDPRLGNISRYALGDDYHEVLKQRLSAAADRIHEIEPDLATRTFVDTGPLNEKLIAARAGIGWVGRHTNLIDRERGSYLFLGLLLVSAELEPTGPEEVDRCGLCTDCIPACPTGAIVRPYVLDARRCISYLTIELKGPIPRDLRPYIGNRIFGCDDCQEVCPWNRFATKSPPESLASRPGLRDTDLATWLALDRDAWKELFRGSPVKRPGYAGFLRNVLVAAGCSNDRTLAPSVRALLTHGEPLVRAHAAWAAGRLGDSDGLRACLPQENDPGVREEIAAALQSLSDGTSPDGSGR